VWGTSSGITISSNKISGKALNTYRGSPSSLTLYGSGISLAVGNPGAVGPSKNKIDIYPGDLEDLEVNPFGGHVRMDSSTSGNEVYLHGTASTLPFTPISDEASSNEGYPPIYIRDYRKTAPLNSISYANPQAASNSIKVKKGSSQEGSTPD
jgi:hypothetical protein